ncbi:preprotein translocase subunit YajC [Paludibacter sp. 221]|uniref:preprotein translocase subunit YajC n=1 Tax=Paludibacter sp. 221 TaxID=2302939 RepID=UPI0013D68381|nr:preprotein translocase subunit YajC [Paludibacter sp. 221]NDV45955.1 preprotein translocase subunit YajC [Paludibacter sp. 221]
MNLLSILLQATAEGAEEAAQGGLSSYSGLIMMLLIFVVFYFFMIRPQSKRQKEIKKQRDAMKPGDKVVTSGGIYGKIKDVKDNAVVIEIAENVRIKVDKNSVFVTAEDIQTEAK